MTDNYGRIQDTMPRFYVPSPIPAIGSESDNSPPLLSKSYRKPVVSISALVLTCILLVLAFLMWHLSSSQAEESPMNTNHSRGMQATLPPVFLQEQQPINLVPETEVARSNSDQAAASAANNTTSRFNGTHSSTSAANNTAAVSEVKTNAEKILSPGNSLIKALRQ